jgi:hypothetical protein
LVGFTGIWSDAVTCQSPKAVSRFACHRAPHVAVALQTVVKSSQKLYRFFTDFFTGRGRGGRIWLDLVGFGWTGFDWVGLG